MQNGQTKNIINRLRLNMELPALLSAILVVALVAAMVPGEASAQSAIRAWGMGGANTADARGLGAVDYNPANLAFSNGTSINLVGVAMDVHNNSISLNRYNEITGAHLSVANKDRIMADIPETGFELNAEMQASGLGLHTGPFALTFGAMGVGNGNLDKDYFDLVLFGNEIGQTVDFSDTHGSAYALGTATLSYGKVIRTGAHSRLSVGLNMRYLHGVYEMHVENASGSISTSMDEIAGDAYVSTISSEGGQGYGVDLGVALQAPRGWTLGLVLDNLYTNVDWNTNVERQEFRVIASDLNILNDSIDDAVADTDTTYAAEGYSTSLPRRVRIGAANRMGNFNMAFDYTQGFENRGNTSKTPQLNIGTEWAASGIAQPRFGIRLGGASGNSVAAGLGLNLGFWHLDFAAVSRSGFKPGTSKGIGFAVGSSLVF